MLEHVGFLFELCVLWMQTIRSPSLNGHLKGHQAQFLPAPSKRSLCLPGPDSLGCQVSEVICGMGGLAQPVAACIERGVPELCM